MSDAKEWPLVSYVVASYNHAKYVRSAIESILSQNYPAIELIVVDDGSTDGSRGLLRTLSREKGFRLVEKENGGVVSAINTGVALASGTYVVPHASDDISHPDRTRLQVRQIQQFPGAGFVVGGIRKIDENGKWLADSPGGGRRCYRFEDFRQGKASVPAVSCMYRTDAIRAVLPLDETLAFEDVQLFWRVTEMGWECLHDDQVTVVDYRIVTASLGRRSKVRLWRDFARFIRRYEQQAWYAELMRRALSGLFVQLAIEEKPEAARFLFHNAKHIDSKALLRGCVLLFVPRWAVQRLRAGY
ncbi:glycosyltransferase family 2 protein [Thermomonas sp.]|uniref:glycosyltransferase family 2 protein n=1 Tax=Thermomonas sp. TaxID=1971895 RepID=UPI0035B194D3